jgi:hypothetical protein
MKPSFPFDLRGGARCQITGMAPSDSHGGICSMRERSVGLIGTIQAGRHAAARKAGEGASEKPETGWIGLDGQVRWPVLGGNVEWEL